MVCVIFTHRDWYIGINLSNYTNNLIISFNTFDDALVCVRPVELQFSVNAGNG